METEAGYEFAYETAYLESGNAAPVSLTLPLRREPYQSNVLFPFFDGLIPPGTLHLNQCRVENAISNMKGKLPVFKEIISRSFLN